MRIALIQTPIEDFYYTPQRSYPLGLTYLASSIKDLPVEIKIIDLISGHGRQTIKTPVNFKLLQNFLPYDRSPISAFHTFYHVGLSWTKIEDLFSHDKYDIYAISSNFYTYSNEVLKTAKIIKRTNPNAVIVVGGQNVGPEHSLFTDSSDIDHCIQGEGDMAFKVFMQALLNDEDLSSVPGIYHPSDKKWSDPGMMSNVDIKPLSELLPAQHYSIGGDPAIMISTSRGCPMACRFCSVSRTFGKTLRLKPIETIIDEMREAYQRGIVAFDIEDDNFTFHHDHCTNLLSRISDEFKGSIKLYAMNGLSAEHLNEQIIDLLYRSGMSLLNLSIATSSDDQLKTLHRHTSIDRFKRISTIAAKRGMKVMGHFIAGLPGQTVDEVILTMRVLGELPLVLGISPFYYIPGMNMTVPNIPLNCKDARLTRFWPADTFMNELDLITLFRLSRWLNYVKSKMSDRKLKILPFNQIADIFHDDPYIYGLINDRVIYGLDNRGKLFPHDISRRIIESFFGIFNDSTVYCA